MIPRLVLSLCLCLNLFTFSVSGRAEELVRLPDLTDSETMDRPSDAEVEAARREIERRISVKRAPLSTSDRRSILRNYNHLDPQNLVPDDLLEEAVIYFDRHISAFDNRQYISIVDFGQRSNHARLFVINMNSGAVQTFHTTHGSGSDVDNDGYAESFGNVSGSHKSSVGFYYVAETYNGNHGRSVRLDGLSSTNSNVRARAIVVHGSDYVHEDNVIQGRSQGCFALAWSIKDQVVDKIHGGSLLYAQVSDN